MSLRYKYVTPDPDASGKTKEVFVEVPADVQAGGAVALEAFHQEQLARYPEPPKQSEVEVHVVD